MSSQCRGQRIAQALAFGTRQRKQQGAPRVEPVRLAERPGLVDSPELPALLRTLVLHHEPKPETETGVEHGIIYPAVFDPDHPGGLAGVLQALLRVASVVRDRMSNDMWRVLSGLSELPAGPADEYGECGPTPADVLARLNRVVITLAAFGGLAVESMTRGDGWRFLDMGRKLERAYHMILLLRGTLVRPVDPEGPVLDAVLEVADSGMTYRRRYMSSLRVEAVLDLLVFDDTNPRSLASQLAALEDDVSHLPQAAPPVELPPEQRLTLAARNAVQLVDAEKLAGVYNGSRPALGALLGVVGEVLPTISDTITQQYLSHLQTSRHLAGDFLQFNTVRKP